MKTEIAKSDIEQFSTFIKQGVEAWTNAGILLVQMVDSDKNAFAKICKSLPEISVDMLVAFERIGRRKLNPYLMLDNSPGANRLMMLPIESQNKYYSEKIQVVTNYKDGEPVVEFKSIRELSRAESHRVFSDTGVRTVEEQSEMMPDFKKQAIRRSTWNRHEKSSFVSCGFYKIVLDAKGMPSMVKCEAPKNNYSDTCIEIVGNSRIGFESQPFSIGLRSEPFEVVKPKEAIIEMDSGWAEYESTPKNPEKDIFNDQIQSCQKQIEEKEEAITRLDASSPVVKRLRKEITKLQDKIVKYELLSS